MSGFVTVAKAKRDPSELAARLVTGSRWQQMPDPLRSTSRATCMTREKFIIFREGASDYVVRPEEELLMPDTVLGALVSLRIARDEEGEYVCIDQVINPEEQTLSADAKQVGGGHYKVAGNPAIEHWNLVTAYGWDYFTAQIIKYLMRWPHKNGLQDLHKARHFLDKLIELEEARLAAEPGPGYVDQG